MKDEKISRSWQWQTVEGGSYLTCGLLSSWQHGFFTKDFYPRTPKKLTSVLQPEAIAYRTKQVHGNLVLTPQEINIAIKKQDSSNSFPDADAVISDRPNQSVWVASADCTPILFGDRQTGQVGAIHAGWRGTSQAITKQAIARFIESGSHLENLRIAIGPAISGEVYQVDEVVAIEVCKTIVANGARRSDAEMLKELQQLSNSPIADDELPGKVRLNVARVNQIQLEQLNINPQQIAIAQDFCTYQQNELFFSYRRTGEKKVQWSGIVSTIAVQN